VLPFPLLDAPYHTATVKSRDLELTECGDPQASSIERREDGAGFEPAGSPE
jgi:hypothetical protein